MLQMYHVKGENTLSEMNFRICVKSERGKSMFLLMKNCDSMLAIIGFLP